MRPSVRPSLLPLLAAALFSCSGSEGEHFYPPVLELPANPNGADGYEPLRRYGAMDVPDDNPLNPRKAALGWQLYHDARLSGDGTRSCYSCHLVEHGLTDGKPVAVGAFDKVLTRNSPTLWNIGFHQSWYWDGRASSLESQAAAAWKGANMGASEPQAIVDFLNQVPGYLGQFLVVFGEPATVDNVPMALAAYMRTIVSDGTAFDRWQSGDDDAVSEQAKRGFEVFTQAGCAECHAGVLLTDLQFHNVGIGMDGDTAKDVGRAKVTNDAKDTGAFKTPTLRDVTKSAPYFHDGSVATLEEAVRFMAGGGKASAYRSTKLKDAKLTDAQIADVLAFLATLEQPCDEVIPPLP
ncbi:MAG: c-type cytochrome [Planctomycetes bacterium]|nr:c-type cytochrome [Planctomycetota bacterium]